MSDATLQTTFEFTLPHGYVDDEGTRHRSGRMRLATAADELKPLNDPRVQSNGSYMTVIVLSRVVTELGEVEAVTPGTIEDLFVADLAHLQDLYTRVNGRGTDVVDATCPECGAEFGVSTAHASAEPTAARADGGEGSGNAEGPGSVGPTAEETEEVGRRGNADLTDNHRNESPRDTGRSTEGNGTR